MPTTVQGLLHGGLTHGGRIDDTKDPSEPNVPGLLHALISTTRDAVMWKTYRAFRLPFGVVIAVGKEWR